MHRDALIVGGIMTIAIIGGVLFSLLTLTPDILTRMVFRSPTETVTQSVAAVPFTEIAHGSHATVLARTNYLIVSSTELGKLWKMVDAKGKVPAIDFNTKSVIAVFAGSKPTGGYAITVSKVEDARTRKVTILVTKPGSNCVLAQSVAAPYQLIEVSKTSLALTHKDLIATATACK